MSRKRPRPNHHEYNMARALDELAAFEAFKEDILPELQQDLKKGLNAESLYKKYHALAAARAITIAAKETDSGKALSAIKDILDRTAGKATEKHEVEHKYAQLKDEELDSLILTELSEVDEEELAN